MNGRRERHIERERWSGRRGNRYVIDEPEVECPGPDGEHVFVIGQPACLYCSATRMPR